MNHGTPEKPQPTSLYPSQDIFGGVIGGAILGVSLAVIMLMFKYMFFHTGLSYATLCFFFFVGLIAGMVCAVYVAYRTMATLIDN